RQPSDVDRAMRPLPSSRAPGRARPGSGGAVARLRAWAGRGTCMKHDVLIVGGGPAGSAAAMCLGRHGIKPVIGEREPFPRYHIGESMTGEAGGVLRGLGLGERLSSAGHPVKHGVKVYGPRSEWFVPVMQRADDGALSDQVTWQVRRSVFDAMMLE